MEAPAAAAARSARPKGQDRLHHLLRLAGFGSDSQRRSGALLWCRCWRRWRRWSCGELLHKLHKLQHRRPKANPFATVEHHQLHQLHPRTLGHAAGDSAPNRSARLFEKLPSSSSSSWNCFRASGNSTTTSSSSSSTAQQGPSSFLGSFFSHFSVCLSGSFSRRSLSSQLPTSIFAVLPAAVRCGHCG